MRVNRVLLSAPQGICAGLASPFSGLYMVSKKLGSNVYELIDEEGDIVPRVPNGELKHAFLDEVLEPALGKTGDQVNPETEQISPEVEQIAAKSQGTGLEKQKGEEEIPRVAKRKRGRPRKTRVVVRRAMSRKFDKRASNKATLNDTKVPEPILVVKGKRGRPQKELVQVPVNLSPLRARAQKAQFALEQNS